MAQLFPLGDQFDFLPPHFQEPRVSLELQLPLVPAQEVSPDIDRVGQLLHHVQPQEDRGGYVFYVEL